jgi:isopropylmalate/homocitrate/citramalate synthase
MPLAILNKSYGNCVRKSGVSDCFYKFRPSLPYFCRKALLKSRFFIDLVKKIDEIYSAKLIGYRGFVMRENHFEDGKWWVSPYNFVPEVRQSLMLPPKVQIHDATLRDGEQTPGVVFSIDDKIRIATKLDEIGIDRIEAGMPAVSPMDAEAIKEISKLGLKSRIFTFARAMKQDIDMALECGAHGVIVEVPIGYPKLVTQFGWTWEDVFKKSRDVINYAKEQGLYVVFFPYDTTRARANDLSNLCKAIMAESPPDSIGIVGTMGCATPEAIKYMVGWVKDMTGLPIEIHTHNDFGLGVATELAAVTAGAEVVHSCGNGLGERTGNAALEELILGLELLYGYETGYRMDKLPELGDMLAQLSGEIDRAKFRVIHPLQHLPRQNF